MGIATQTQDGLKFIESPLSINHLEGTTSTTILDINKPAAGTPSLEIYGNLTFDGDSRYIDLAKGTTSSQPFIRIGEQSLYGFSMRWDSGSHVQFDGWWNTTTGGGANRDFGSLDVNNRIWKFEGGGDTLTINGNRALTTADEGSGNGLDADTVDGFHVNANAGGLVKSYQDVTTTFHSGVSGYRSSMGMVYASDGPNSGNDWYRFIQPSYREGSGSTNVWQTQLAFYGTGGDFWLRQREGGNFGSSGWGSWHRVWTSNTDGSSSGLDADLVDGIHASSFLRSDTADTATGQLFFDAGFDSHPIMLSGAQNFDNIDRSGFYNLYNTHNSSTNSPGFHYGTMIAIGNDKGSAGFGLQIAHERTGAGMYVRGMNDTGSTWYDWDEIWTSGTHGSGSGLDADTLDSYEASAFPRKTEDAAITGNYDFSGTGLKLSSHFYTRRYDANGNVYFHVGTADSVANILNLRVYDASNAVKTLVLNGGTGAISWNGNTILTTADEGSGNGLDADTLDGVEGSSYLRSDATDTFTNLVGQSLEFDKLVYDWTAGSVVPIIELKNATSYGIFYHEGSPDAMKFSTSGNTNYELAFSSSGITHRGNTMWHAGNDGSGSGLDADTVDGVQGSSFLRSDEADTAGGTSMYVFNKPSTSGYQTALRVGSSGGGLYLTSDNAIIGKGAYYNNGWIATATSGSGIDFQTNEPKIFSHSGATVGSAVTMSTSYNIFHQGNDGSGSGLDADTVDGIHGASFLRSDAADTASGDITFTGSTRHDGGLYFVGDSNMGFVPYPMGGQFRSDSSSHTGYILIKLPTDIGANPDDMMSFYVDIYDYSTGEMISVYVGGYVYTTSGSTGNYWYNCTAIITSKRTDKDFNVRYGNDGTNYYVAIGETNTTWAHPSVVVRDFQCSFRGQSSHYVDGWSVSISTSTLSGVDETQSTNYPVSQQWKTARTITLSGDLNGSVSLDGSADVTLSAQVVNNSHTHDDRYYTETESDARFLRGDTSDTMAGRLTLHTGGTNTYGLIAGYGNDNHFITMRGKVTTGTGTLTVTGGHQMTFVEHADAADEGWYFVSKASGNYTEMARIDGVGQMYIGGNKVWHAGNDGSGSTLDADTLDGLDLHTGRNNQVNKVVRTDANGYIQAGWINTTSGSTSDDISRIYASNDGYIRYYTPSNFLNGGGIAEDLFNNQTRSHSAYTNFNDTGLRAGVNYIQGGTNGPTGSGQWYGFRLGLGGNYGTITGTSGHYASELYWGRKNQTSNNYYLYSRDLENGTWTSWVKMNAGEADAWTTARTITLAGDLSGSVSIDGSADVTLTATVADDSHDLTWDNIDGETANSVNDWGGLRHQTNDGYIDFGPANTSWAHIYTDRPAFYTNKDIYVNNSRVLKVNNEGSGGGIDADTLDGQEGTYYAQASLSNNKTYTSTGNAAGSYLGGHYSSGGNEKPNAGTFGAGKLKLAMLSSSNLGFGGSWNDVLWLSAYTGSDVKGSHALVFDKYSSNVYVSDQAYDSTSWGTGYKLWHSGNDGAGTGLDADLFDAMDSNRFVTGSNSRRTYNSNPNSALNSGFYDVYQTNAPTATWYSYINMAHTNTANQHGHQIAGSFYGDGDLFNRHYDGTTASFGNWSRIWNEANDGAGTGLNADLVDGLHASSFLRSDTTNSLYRVTAGNGNRIRFWDSDSYAIWMSSATDGTWGGRVPGETTSDYNMYFRMTSGTNRGFVFQNSTTEVAGIDGAGNIRSIADVIAYSSSDKKFKDELKVIENPLDKISNINGYNFIWNDKQTTYESGKKDIGVVAQEIEKVLPEIVNTRENGSKAVKYDKIVALLIEGIKELKDEVEELKNKKCNCNGSTK